ncbi:unnamed protein product [Colias eurytheme]|nr:unnamed protein product [Colias eurytheme]
MPKKKGQKKAKNSTIYAHIREHDRNLEDEVIDDEASEIKKSNKKKRNHTSEGDNIDNRPGVVYPEIIWYLISAFVHPEDVGTFAAINKSTYAITKRESFWYSLYKRYCANHMQLPKKLRIEENYRAYGLRQRVIRALYNTHDVFLERTAKESVYDSRPHALVGRRCVNSWFTKGQLNWSVFFKLKKQGEIIVKDDTGRVDANPEEGTKVLQVFCKTLYNMPPLMGLTLSTVSLTLSQGFSSQKLHLGFNKGNNVSRNIFPECSIVLDSVVSMNVFDWWHSKYPHFEVKPPILEREEDSTPVLDVDFFDMCDDDINL